MPNATYTVIPNKCSPLPQTAHCHYFAPHPPYPSHCLHTGLRERHLRSTHRQGGVGIPAGHAGWGGEGAGPRAKYSPQADDP